MDREQREMFYWNIVKFVVGVILLSISYVYIQNHPAEKVSILSGFQVMYERGQVFVYRILGRDSFVLREKHRVNQFYQELMRSAESRDCVSADLLAEIFDTHRRFSQATMDELKESIHFYSQRASQLNDEIRQECGDSSYSF